MDLFDDLPEPAGSQEEIRTKIEMCSENAGNIAGSQLESGCKRKNDDNNVINKDVKKKCQESQSLFKLKSYVKERKGEREDMEDAHVIEDQLDLIIFHRQPSVCRISYFGVFDGHGGSRASQYAAKHLHLNIVSKFPKGNLEVVKKEMKKCLIEAHKKTDEEFLKQAAKIKPTWKDGSTAVTVSVINNTMYISNLGDSKAILARYNEEKKQLMAVPLTTDHNPMDYEERMRIQRAGGFVKDGRVMGIIEVSRSIGDGQFKKCGITCIPDVKRCQITNHDRFLVLACDGLWKVFTPTLAVNFVNEILQDEASGSFPTKEELDARYETACLKLANDAVRKGSGDNITVLLIAISAPL